MGKEEEEEEGEEEEDEDGHGGASLSKEALPEEGLQLVVEPEPPGWMVVVVMMVVVVVVLQLFLLHKCIAAFLRCISDVYSRGAKRRCDWVRCLKRCHRRLRCFLLMKQSVSPSRGVLPGRCSTR